MKLYTHTHTHTHTHGNLLIKIGIAVAVVIAVIVIALIWNANNKPKKIRKFEPEGEIARSMTYNQVQDGDEDIANTDYVKFDAFFLRDLDGDGNAEGVRGSCRKIGQNDTLYMELSVQTNGQFEDGIITINGTNMTLKTAIPKDNEIAENAIGSNIKEIKFNTIKSGTQKLVTGVISSSIGNNINNYTKINSVTLKGTHVANDGTRTPIEKTVEFTIDWHGTVRAEMPTILAGSNNLNQGYDLSKAINEEEGTFTVEETIGMQEVNDQLLLEKAHVEAEIPELNGYTPTKVELVGNDGTYTYNEETKKLVIDRVAELNENGTIRRNVYDGNYAGCRYNKFKVRITYPIEAYRTIEEDSVELKIPVKGYYEGYNNNNEEFETIYKSNIVSSTFIITLSNPRGTVAIFDVTVGKYISSPRSRNIVSKGKLLKVYNGTSDIQDDDTYIVRWYGSTGSDGKSTGMVMQENPEEVGDKFVKSDSSLISMEEVTTNIGIYFSNPENMLGEDGWIHIYDNETNELLETFTKDNWGKYDSNNIYRYQRPVKHIRIETSATSENTSIYVYNVKKLDDEKIITTYTREEFDELQYIRSSIVGYLGGEKINTDVHSAEYEATHTDLSISLNKGEISTQETEKNMTITIEAKGEEYLNQSKWLNGAFLLKMPNDIINIDIKGVQTDNKAVNVISYEQFEIDGIIYVKINTENDNPTTFNINIDCEITPNPQMMTKTENLELYAYNEEAVDYWNKAEDTLDINDNLNTTEMIGKTTKGITLVSPDSLLTSEMVTNYDNNESIAIAPNIAVVEKDQRTANMNVVIMNNYSNTISEVKILGRIPYEGNKYVINKGELGSNFSSKMAETGITVPAELQEKATIYYSENEEATNDLSDSQNGWTTAPVDFSKVKSYLIDLGDYALTRGEKQTFTYTVNLPEGLNYNQVTYGHHAVYFSLDTTEGKYKTQVEPNKVGIMIAKQYTLEVTKYQNGKEKIVSGATYSITEEGKEEGKTRVTNINGKLTLENLYIDKTYILKEIKTPKEYEINPEEIKFKATEENGELKLNVISGTTKRAEAIEPQNGEGYKVAIDVEDEARVSLKIVKTEEGTETVLPSVQFRLTGKNFEKGRALRTNTSGEITLKGLSIGEEYTLEEIKAEGYYLLEAPIKFVIENNNGTYTANIKEGQVKTNEIVETDSIPTIVLNIENEKIPRYNLQINKVVKGETTPLAGAKFRLFKGTEKIDDYITDESGIITINNLYQYEETKGIDQTYTLKELLAPDGYSAIKDITFKVSKSAEGLLVMDIQEGKIKEQTVGENDTVIITIEDSKSFKLIKTDGETGEVLPNTKFAIYNVDNGIEEIARDSKNNILGTKEIINGRVYYTLTTNEKGEIEADLKEGMYKAIEVKASHDKYDLTDNTYYFGIGASREAEKVMVREWVATYGGSDNDYINSVAETADGGVIAGGYFKETIQLGDTEYTSKGGNDGIIIKYNAEGEGEVEWVDTFGGSGWDAINSVAGTRDGGYIAGGIFNETIEVGGKEYTSKGGSDRIIIKYSAEGEVEWVSTFGGRGWDGINSVAETTDGGYIAGGYFANTIQVGNKTYTSKGSDDGIIIKYSAEGEVEWVDTFGGSNNDDINSVAGTRDGGVIAGGWFASSTVTVGDKEYTSKGSNNGIIIKYSAEGEVEWIDIHEVDIESVAETKDGGIIAGGWFKNTIQVGDKTYTSKGAQDGIIIKYSAEGEVERVDTFGSSGTDQITSVAGTRDGGVIAGGDFMSDTVTVGDKEYTGKGQSDGIIIKYSAEGEVERVDTFGGSSNDEITSVAGTRDGGYIAGGDFQGTIQVGDKTYTSKGGGNYIDGIIIKYSEKELMSPKIISSATVGGSSNDRITSVAETADGGYIAGGDFQGTIEVGDKTYTSKGRSFDGIIIKYSAEGEVEWVDIVGGSSSDSINSVAGTADGGVIAGGDFSGTIQVGDKTYTSKGRSFDGIIIKYSAEGKVEWSATYGENGNDCISSVAETADGGVIAGGWFQETIQVGGKEYTSKGAQDGIIIKYSAEGEVEWVTTYGGSSNDRITSVAETADGGVIAGGWFASSTVTVGGKEYTSKGPNDGIIIKYSAKGEVEWVDIVGGRNSDIINSVADTADGGVIAGGDFYGTIQVGEKTYTSKGSEDGIIIKYSGEGEVEWVYTVGGSSGDYITSVAGTADGGVIAGGWFASSTVTVGGKEYTSKGSYDGIIIKYSAKGEVEWVATYGGSGNDYINSVAETADGGVIAGGYFMSDTVTVGDKEYTSKGGTDGIIMKVVAYAGVPETELLSVENKRKKFKITTDVAEIDGVKGGSISGEGKSAYEKVKYGDKSTKEISMIPDENYEIIGITVNGEEWPFTVNEDGTYTMPRFENMTEDKHIVVTYSLKDNKIIINKVDSKTKEAISGVKFKLDQIEERSNPENVIGVLTDNGETYTRTELSENEVTGVLGELTDIGTSGYYFRKKEDGTYIPTNGKTYQIANGGTDGKHGVTANSYIPIDLTGLTGKYAVVVNAYVSSESSDYGYATITETTSTVPAYSNSTGRFMYISGTSSAVTTPKDYTSMVLEGGKTYYLYLGYRKDSSGSREEDQVVINNVKVYEATENDYTYDFIEEDEKYKSSNQGQANTVCNSYIPVDLTDCTGTYKLIVNAEVSSQSSNDYGYATVTTAETRPAYNSSTGRFIYISGTQSAKDYTTVLQGGQKYYLHLGYYKNATTDTGSDTFTINSVKLELNEGDLDHTEITTNSLGQAITQINFGKYTLTEVDPPEEYQPLEKTVIIEFKGDNRAVLENENKASITVNENGEFVVENTPKAKVVVHHYLKDRNGEYTEEPVAEDEIVYGDYDKWYTTQPHLDLEEYDLEKDSNNQYAIPENATGEFQETNEDVIYYYEERQYPVIVHHYISGTMTPVRLADGTTAKDEEILGYVGELYETKVKEDLAYGYEYESVEGVVSGNHVAGTIEITYYYKVFTDVEVVKKWDNTNNKYDKPESVTVELLADGEVLQEITLTRENKIEIEGEPETQETWKYTFTKLPKYDDKDKHEIVYTVREK